MRDSPYEKGRDMLKPIVKKKSVVVYISPGWSLDWEKAPKGTNKGKLHLVCRYTPWKTRRYLGDVRVRVTMEEI